MPKSLILSGPGSTSISASYISPAQDSYLLGSSVTESIVAKTMRVAGTFSNAYVYVANNTRTGFEYVKLRKNSSAGNISVAIPTASSGVFYDLSNTDSVTAGDVVSFSLEHGGAASGTCTIGSVSMAFSYSGANSMTLLSHVSFSYATASSSRWFALTDPAGAVTVTEAITQHKTKLAGTYKNLAINVSANARTNTTTVVLRKNGASTSLSVGVPATSTGLFEDTSNTSTVVADDLVNYQISSGSGTETITLTTFINKEASGSSAEFNAGLINTVTTLAGAAMFFPPNANTQTATETSVQKAYIPFDATISNWTVNIGANSVTATSVLTSKKSTIDVSNKLVDGDMEAAGTSSWTASTSSLSKQSTGPHSGTQVLRVTGNGAQTYGYATQAVLTVGKTYKITGYVRSNGAQIPEIYLGNAKVFQGTNSTSWQPISVIGTCTSNTSVYLGQNNGITGYVEFDDMTIVETPTSAGNCSISIPSSTTGWFEDVSHSDSISAGNYYYFSLDPGDTGTSLVVRGLNFIINGGADASSSKTLTLLGVGA